MKDPGTHRLATSLMALIIGFALYLASPPAPRAQAGADPRCNLYNSGQICKIQEDCVWILFYKKCTTEYWRLDGDSGGDEEPPEPILE